MQGISIGNFNMGCNFQIEAAIQIMVQYELAVLSIQEHTPWSKELSQMEISSIERHCEKYSFFPIITKLQIIIIDKRLTACYVNNVQHYEGHIISTRFEISLGKYVDLISVYGYPHSPNSRSNQKLDENSILQNMQALAHCTKKIILQAKRNNIKFFIFGDLQDTPDGTKNFHYGTSRISKHPLGIIKTCEDNGLACTIYNHLDSFEKPIISRHGPKGGEVYRWDVYTTGIYALHYWNYYNFRHGNLFRPQSGH